MNSKTTFSFLPLPLNWRRELRFALLAAMETCWVYAVALFLASVAGFPRVISPLAVFIAYWIAVLVGRGLPQRKERWIILQALAIAIALGTMLAVARIELYEHIDWLDFSWLPRYSVNLFSFATHLAPEHLSAVAVIFAFIRGLGFGQRPMTLWFTGYQFRLGIVIFFLLLVSAGMLKPFDASLALFAYFFVSLIAIALARMEEMESEQRLNFRWSFTLVAAVAIVLILGLLLLQFLTVDSASFLLWLLTPVWLLISAILLLIAIPAGFLAGWLVDLLRPLYGQFEQMLTQLGQSMPAGTQGTLNNLQERATSPEILAIIKTLFIAAVVLVVGYWVARALQRRMKHIEEETYIRESLGVDERFGERGRMVKKKPAVRKHPSHIAAESIRRIYAALVARAAENGLTREVAETPYEFEPRLENRWAEESNDIRAITQAYVDVHYAEHTATEERAKAVREAWERMKKRMNASREG